MTFVNRYFSTSHANLILLILAGLCVPGCMCGRRDLVQEGKIQMKTHNSCKTRFTFVTVYEDEEGNLKVYGQVIRQKPSSCRLHTGIAIQVLDSNQKLLETQSIPCMCLPRKGAGKGPDTKRFSFYLKSKYSEGMKVIA